MSFLNRILHPISYAKAGTLSPVGVGAAGEITATIVAHGIYTGNSDTDWSAVWSWRFSGKGCIAKWLSYWTGAFLTGNKKNANRLAQLVRDARGEGAKIVKGIGHSNGCLLWTMALLQNPDDVVVDELWLLAGAVTPDCRKHLNTLVSRGQVRQVILGISKNDGVVGTWLQWITPTERGNTLGVDGFKNQTFGWVECDFSKVAGQFPIGIQGRDDTKGHCDWTHDDVFEVIAQTIEVEAVK